MSKFKSIAPDNISDNIFKLIGHDWMLVTAAENADGGKINTMTASWGGAGVIWGKNAAFIFIRPQRYTYSFIEASDRFTLSFFTEEYKNILGICGKVSGKDRDKIKECGLTPVITGSGKNREAYFEEARLVLRCRKMYADDIRPEGALDTSILSNYTSGDYHRMYIAEIEEALLS